MIIDLGSYGNSRRVYGRNLRDKRYSLLPEVISFGEREDIRTLLDLGLWVFGPFWVLLGGKGWGFGGFEDDVC